MATKYKKGSDGRFKTKVFNGTYKDGKKQYTMIASSKSSRDLELKVKAFEEGIKNVSAIQHHDPNISFGDYADEWCKLYKSNLARGTQEKIKWTLKNLDLISPIPVKDIQLKHYQIIHNMMLDRTSALERVYTVFRQIIKRAMADRLLNRDTGNDILDHMPKKKHQYGEKRALTDNEMKAISRVELPTEELAFLHILFSCGLRRGEALALQIDDIDLVAKTVSVTKALDLPSDKNSAIKGTKNGKHRVVRISDHSFDYVKNHVLSCKSNDFLFTQPTTGKKHSCSSYKKMFERILKALNAVADEPIEGLTAHVFRHNFCTSLCKLIGKTNITFDGIAYVLGDNAKMVLEVYNHLTKEDEKNVMDVLGDAMNIIV